MTGFENHLGFTISSSKLQVVEVIQKEDQFVLENVDEAFFNEPINLELDKETKVISLLQGAFDEILVKNPPISSTASFSLPPELFKVTQLPYDNTLLHQDLIEEFRWELSLIYPDVNPANLVIQYLEIDKNRFIKINTAIIIALSRIYIQVIKNFCDRNKMKLKFIDNIHLASERALTAMNSASEKGLTLSVFLSGSIMSLIFSYQGKPIYFKVFPLNDATDIVKFLTSELNSNQYPDINRDFLESAFICGVELSSSMINTLREKLDLPFIHFNPFAKIKPNPGLFENKYYSEKFNSFSPAAGVALRLA
jgi:Tfp pilus assembly PilM family ATPase